MLITFISIGYVYISKICFDFLKRIIPHTSWAFMLALPFGSMFFAGIKNLLCTYSYDFCHFIVVLYI